jgi:hypothetical protein
MIPVGDEAADPEPRAFEALTTTRRRFPASTLCSR